MYNSILTLKIIRMIMRTIITATIAITAFGLLFGLNASLAADGSGLSAPGVTQEITSNNINSSAVQEYSYSNYSSPEASFSADGALSSKKLHFHERLSYTGACNWLPKGTICLIYSDNYKWIVTDYFIDSIPTIVGNSNCLPVELIRCYYADYYHVLGTSLVMSIPRAEKIQITFTPLQCTN
jgi:hypothetical protein